MLSLLDLGGGDASAAHQRAGDAFALYSQLEDDRSRARCVLVLAGATAARGQGEHAARLVGAADALRGGEPLDEFEAPVLARCVPALESQLGHRRCPRSSNGVARLISTTSPERL